MRGGGGEGAQREFEKESACTHIKGRESSERSSAPSPHSPPRLQLQYSYTRPATHHGGTLASAAAAAACAPTAAFARYKSVKFQYSLISLCYIPFNSSSVPCQSHLVPFSCDIFFLFFFLVPLAPPPLLLRSTARLLHPRMTRTHTRAGAEEEKEHGAEGEKEQGRKSKGPAGVATYFYTLYQ